jgi:hypothetical protein
MMTEYLIFIIFCKDSECLCIFALKYHHNEKTHLFVHQDIPPSVPDPVQLPVQFSDPPVLLGQQGGMSSLREALPQVLALWLWSGGGQ